MKLLESWFEKINEQYALLNSSSVLDGISGGGWAKIPFKWLTEKDMDIVTPENRKESKGLLG